MRNVFLLPSIALLTLALALGGLKAAGQNSQPAGTSEPPAQQPAQPQAQQSAQPETQAPAKAKRDAKLQNHSAGGEVGSGAGDVGKGTARGVGAAAEGVGKGAGDLVTLHPIDAAGNVGKGAVVAGKDVGVGVDKGTGKIAKGTGRGIGKLFHHHHKQPATPAATTPQN